MRGQCAIMIFEQENLQLQLLDVLYFNDSDVIMRTKARPFCALSLRLRGDTDIEIKKETVHLGTDDIAFFPANIGYLRRSGIDERIVFHFNVLNFVPYELEVLHDFSSPSMQALFVNAMHEWNGRRPGYQYRTSALLYSVFSEIQSRRSIPHTPRSAVINNALAYIAGHYTDPALTVNQLAQQAHLSETHFRNLFHHDLGVTPKKYINDMRLEHAQSLLNAGYDTVATVAVKVGFRDAKNFATAFRKSFGYPPSDQHYEP